MKGLSKKKSETNYHMWERDWRQCLDNAQGRRATENRTWTTLIQGAESTNKTVVLISFLTITGTPGSHNPISPLPIIWFPYLS